MAKLSPIELDKEPTLFGNKVIESVNILYDKVEDTGWVNLEMLNGMTTNALSAKPPLQYRMVGSYVQIRGSVGNVVDGANPFAKLPAKVRPTGRLDFVGAMSGSRQSRYYISPNGDMRIEMNDTNSFDPSWWYAIDVCFLAL